MEEYILHRMYGQNYVPPLKSTRVSYGSFEDMKDVLKAEGYEYSETQVGQDIYLHKTKEDHLATLGPVKREINYL